MSFGNKMRMLLAGSACLLLALALAVSYGRIDHEKEIMDALFFECAVEGERILLQPWQDEEEGRYYLFLPSCFRKLPGEFTIRCSNRGTLRINGISYKDGDVFRAKEEETYRMELTGAFGVRYLDKSLQVLVSENMPALLFSVEAADEVLKPDEFANKKYLETGSLVMLGENGEVLCDEKLERFKIRGNLTATLDKKPFTFSFHNPTGLCGMTPARKWNLLANATDGSYMRNKIVLDLANESMEGYQPDGEFAEVYLNGIYQGLYLLTEAVEAAPGRLELDPEESRFLEMELDFRREEDAAYVTTERGQIFEIKDLGEVGVDEKEKAQVLDLLNDVESALFSENGVSRISGKTLGGLIDLDSWAEAFLIQEISGDHDTGIASQFSYMSREENALLYAGPVWDYDGAMGNVNTAMYRNPQALTASIEQTRPEGDANQNRWLAAMYRNPEFQRIVEDKYENVFRANLESMLSGQIESYEKLIATSAALDALRWHSQRLSWMFVIPEGLRIEEEGGCERFDTLLIHTAMVKDFLSRKKEFLDRLWVEKRDYCVVEVRNEAPFLNQDYNQTLYFWVERGTEIQGLPQYRDEGYRFDGYEDIKSGQIISDGSVIGEDCVLEGRWTKKDAG